MKRSMLGAYWTIWSQQKPIASLGKTVVGFTWANVAPPSFEYAANQFAETKTTPASFVAPLGSAIVLPLIPSPLFTWNVTSGGSPSLAFWIDVVAGGVAPATNLPLGTVQREPFTSFSKRGERAGNGAPPTSCAASVVSRTGARPGAAGGRTTSSGTTKACRPPLALL